MEGNSGGGGSGAAVCAVRAGFMSLCRYIRHSIMKSVDNSARLDLYPSRLSRLAR